MKDTPFSGDQLLAMYDRVAGAEDAIPRLRRFVLDLAVRGKLVEQDAGDEPASVLLERIEVEKAKYGNRNAQCKVSANPDALPMYPRHWVGVTIESILLELQTGPFGSSLHKKDYVSAGTPVINPASIQNGRIIPIDTMAVGPDTLERLASFKLRNGDIVMARRGEMGRCALVEETESGWLCGTGSLILRPSTFVYGPFLVLLIGSPTSREYLGGSAVGSTMQNLNQSILLGLPFALPPLAEQHRIVAKVQELMALLDGLEAVRGRAEGARDKLTAATLHRLTDEGTDPQTATAFALQTLPALTTRPDQIKPLRQTILNLAVRGKLVAQDPADEPASVLLERITSDKKEHAVSARDRRAGLIKPLNSDGVPFDLPRSWLWVAFGDITISRDGERVPVSKVERENRAKIYDYYGASGVIDKIDGYLFDKPLLLIGEDGANLINRSTPIAFLARGKYWVNNHAHVLDGLNENYLRYLALFINAIDLKPFVTGTAQPKMNQAKMNSIPVALPPLAEQHRIVAKVDALMALCDQLETALTTTASTRSRLLDTLIRSALSPDVQIPEAAE